MDLCNRCLIQVNATTSIRVRYTGDDNMMHIENCDQVTDPIYLKSWAEKHAGRAQARFQVNDTLDRIKAFSTWQGDPVCSVHLWYLVDAEQKRRRP